MLLLQIRQEGDVVQRAKSNINERLEKRSVGRKPSRERAPVASEQSVAASDSTGRNAVEGNFLPIGRRSTRGGENFLHRERTPVPASDQVVVTSDLTEGKSSREPSRTATKEPGKQREGEREREREPAGTREIRGLSSSTFYRQESEIVQATCEEATSACERCAMLDAKAVLYSIVSMLTFLPLLNNLLSSDEISSSMLLEVSDELNDYFPLFLDCLDVAVLQYQNQKLFQELEALKVEYILCEDKCNNLKKHQETYERIVAVVNNSWEQLVTDLESCSISTNESANTRRDLQGSQKLKDGAFIPIQDDFLSKLFETGATECCSYSDSAGQMESHTQLTSETTKNILQNIVSSINWTWHVREDAASSLQATCSEAGAQLRKSVNDHRMEVRSLVLGVNDLHLKLRLLTNSTYNLRDMDAVFKADQKCLAGELATAMSELEESNSKLASVKAQSDGSNVAPIFYSKLGNKQSAIDVAKNEKEIQDMEAFLKEIQVLVTSRMEEIGNLQEIRIENLKKLVNLQNVLVDINSVSSSGVFLMLKEQLDKSKMEMNQFRISLKKLQVEKDNFLWHEKEVNMEANVAVISGKICEFSKSRIAELEEELPKFIQDRIAMETKVEETLRELGRKEIIAGFKEHVSSLPKEMVAMQSELEKLKDSSSEIHCLRAQVQSLSAILQREVDKLQSMFDKSAGQLHEIKNLHLVV
ncbi:E3 ubiquitin-protein ligase BRE1-like 1 [Dendrobium catenatum]|uniref:E3 ubiquitin protein ligase n=1 Tax=Dendrobium catenatum TaxID=906689 RepID=A0A2I0VRK0_9ASPA|nr:E3 ubiquitin-protein ligase BRE1-like 1 [Dendrobium catenatum]